jgi:hypothetical protein
VAAGVAASTAAFWQVGPRYPEDHPLNPVNLEVSCKEVSRQEKLRARLK